MVSRRQRRAEREAREADAVRDAYSTGDVERRTTMPDTRTATSRLADSFARTQHAQLLVGAGLLAAVAVILALVALIVWLSRTL
jgi:hypothetical protein